MARTRGARPTTQNATASTVPKGKTTRKADAIDAMEVEQPAPGKKAKVVVSKSKRQHEIDNPPTIEHEQAVATKKMRTEKHPTVSEPQAPAAPAQRSDRAHPTTLAAPQKRKRRTKAEMAADKAKADAEKKRLEDLTQENHRAMAQMDIDEDIDRSKTAARTIRNFAAIENDSGEEFVGFADIQDSESESNGEAEDVLTLKVRFLG